MSIARLPAMKKPYSFILCLVALAILTLAGCATQPQATTTDNNSGSPLNRNGGNGLASYMH